MKWIAIFLAGAITGVLALGFLVLGWDRHVTVAPTAPAVIAPAPGAVAVVPAEVPPAAEILPSAPSRVEAALPASPMPDVVTVAPSEPVPGDVPVETPDAPELPPAAASATPGAEGPAPQPALSLLVPVAGITPAQLSDTFTDARGEGRSHDAIDIMAPTGTPVLAVADGRIVKLFNSKPGGLTIYQFDAKDEVAFYYAHLDRYADGLAEGQRVKQGDVIGQVGFTGNASPDGPHLHFAIFVLGPEKNWWQGTAINPYPYLRGR